jgi:hypothetical protein
VRGDDRSSRYPLRGVWFCLILAMGTVRAIFAQEARDEHDARHLNEPIVLAAGRVTRWDAPDGRWVLLQNDSSVLQGVRGIRAREAVVRIADVSTDADKILQVDVYAEGQVRIVGDDSPPRSTFRARIRTAEVRLQCYDSTGATALKSPPAQIPIIRRSAFPAPKPAALATATPGSVSVPPPGALPIVATQAIVSNPAGSQTVDAYPLATSQGAAGSQAGSDAARPVPTPKLDSMVERVQLVRAPVADTPAGGDTSPASDQEVRPARAAQGPGGAQPPVIDLPPIEGAPEVQVPKLRGNREDLPPDIQPLPEPDGPVSVPSLPGSRPGRNSEDADRPRKPPSPPLVPIMPGTQRLTTLIPRSGRKLEIKKLATTPEGVEIWICRGGINIVTRHPRFGTIDIESDEAVIWRGPGPQKGEPIPGPNGETWVDDARQPMEVYLEGNVVMRQDENKFAGKSDQRTIRSPQLFYDFLTDRFLAPDAEINMFAPRMLAPIVIRTPRLEQFRSLVQLPNGTFTLAEQPEIRAEPSTMTGSRFPNPGYKITSSSIDLTRYSRPLQNPNTGKEAGDPNDPDSTPEEDIWRVDARQNFYWGGPIPLFYWPHVVQDIDDLEPPLRMIGFNTNNYFGQQLKTDWNGFRLLGQRRPKFIDLWNIDVDYLSKRTKDFPALGSEMGWYGSDLIRDLQDPYRKNRTPSDNFTQNYFGYFDIWGLKDAGIDVLGTGPAIITNGPDGAGKAGFQRSENPPFQEMRGRFNLRHNQRFLPEDDDHQFEELRLQLEVAYASDRNFIEEYYKRLFDTGMDQETLAYLIWQKDNQYANLWTEANLQGWYTDTQWLPRVDYYRLGDSLFSNMFNYYTHSGADYATIHTDNMVNNPNLFAFLPFDPISNTTGTFSSGRFYTNHELDMPINVGNVVRFVPYVQGQAVGWSDQLGGGPLGHLPTGAMGRIWGAAGLRTEVTAWKKYPWVESDLWNVHGLNNKISLFADARTAWSNVKLNDVAVQDDLDDNTYEYVRRYLAITSFTGGILPSPYDPRHLLLRQTLSPITGTTDVQASMNTVQMGIHQRLQTKRGPIGRRRVVDYMTLDASTTYFPTAARDNFGTPWGQVLYNWQWYIGDRTSIVSAGWFDFFKLVGSSPLNNNLTQGYNPNGLNIITTGVSISRPPRSNIYVGYTIIDTGPIKTSAANVSMSYWLSPKWYGTYATSYDFGDAILLASTFSFTRIGADYITTIGLAVDPQRLNSFNFGVQIVPRLSSGMSSGAGAGGGTFDTRFAPTQ